MTAPAIQKATPQARFSALCQMLPDITLAQLLNCREEICDLLPELRPTLGFDQRSPHHRYDVYTHIAHVVSQVPPDLTLRWAALLHDIGKPLAFTQDETGRGHFKGHAYVSAQMAHRILTDMDAPEPFRQRVVFLISMHMARLTPDRAALRQFVDRFGIDAACQLLALQRADMGSKGVPGEDGQEQFEAAQKMLYDISLEDGKNV